MEEGGAPIQRLIWLGTRCGTSDGRSGKARPEPARRRYIRSSGRERSAGRPSTSKASFCVVRYMSVDASPPASKAPTSSRIVVSVYSPCPKRCADAPAPRALRSARTTASPISSRMLRSEKGATPHRTPSITVSTARPRRGADGRRTAGFRRAMYALWNSETNRSYSSLPASGTSSTSTEHSPTVGTKPS